MVPGKEAGEAFERAAAVQRQNLNEPDDEANTLTDAYSMLHCVYSAYLLLTTRQRPTEKTTQKLQPDV